MNLFSKLSVVFIQLAVVSQSYAHVQVGERRCAGMRRHGCREAGASSAFPQMPVGGEGHAREERGAEVVAEGESGEDEGWRGLEGGEPGPPTLQSVTIPFVVFYQAADTQAEWLRQG